jgi:AraC-like DNA-binding protein
MSSGLLRSSALLEDAPLLPLQSYERHVGVQSDASSSDHVRFWRPLPNLDVVFGAGTVREVPLHAHEALQVLLPASRFVVVGARGRTSAVEPGTVHITRPLELHGVRSADGARIDKRVILVATEVLTTLWGELSGRRQDAPPCLPDGAIQDAWLSTQLSAVFERLRRPLVALESESRLLECLARLLVHHADRPSELAERTLLPSRGVERARDYLRAHISDDVSLDDLARVACLSKWHLLRAFRREYGLSPHSYQTQLRLARVRRLLERGQSASFATYETGFSDQSHLTRRFREFFGFTPARYARQFARERAATQPEVIGRRTTASPRPAA